MPGEHLYAHFFSDDHEGLLDLSVNIIDKTDIHNPTYRLDSERVCSMGYSVPSIDRRSRAQRPEWPSIYARDTISHRTRAFII